MHCIRNFSVSVGKQGFPTSSQTGNHTPHYFTEKCFKILDSNAAIVTVLMHFIVMIE